jgi:Xaa-Pro aminopeptidase
MTALEKPAHADLLLTRRAGRIADELERTTADGWLVYDFRGSNPAFGRLLGSGLPKSTRRAFLYVPGDAEPRLLIHNVDAGNFSRLGLDVRSYGGRDDMVVALTTLLGAARRVLMEYSPGNAIPYVSRVDGGTLDLVRGLGVEVLSSADALASVVAAWDSADIASHERAAAALERCKDGLFSALRGQLTQGGSAWTEVDAQRHLVSLMEAEGLEFDHPPVVAVGPHASDPHYAPNRDVALPIKEGDIVLTDLWAHEARRPDGGEGAYADITWTATAASSPPFEQLRVWEAVRGARDAALQLIQERLAATEPVHGAEVDRAARSVIQTAGFGWAFTHRTGHSLGWRAAHGDGVNIDDYETHDARLLRPGAAFSIEPGIYPRTFGMRSEINVVITPGNALKVTTPPQQELVRLV